MLIIYLFCFRNNWLVATKYLWKFYSFVEMPIFSQNIWGNIIGMWNTRSYIACCLYISIKLFAYIFTWCLILPVLHVSSKLFSYILTWGLILPVLQVWSKLFSYIFTWSVYKFQTSCFPIFWLNVYK